MKTKYIQILNILCFFPSIIFAAPSIDSLPWIDATDQEAIHYVAPFLPRNPVIIEAGVCDGTDTLTMKEKWPKSTIYGFEPIPEHFEKAKAVTKKTRRVNLYPLALFDHVGEVTFYHSSKNGGASSLLEDNLDNIEIPESINHDGVNYQDIPITVNCVTLDHWAKKHRVSKVDFIWLDTEGAELPILQNATSILHKVKVISIEVNFQEFRVGMTQFSELYDFLESQGFTLKHIWGNPEWQGVAIFVNESNVR